MADIKIQLYKKTGSNFDSILLQNADWYGIPNKPTTYTPTAHTHTISNITNLQTTLNSKQATLVSGTNIKTINNQSILGSGNIAISGGSGGGGDAYLANTQTFTGVNTFTQNVNLNRNMSSWSDPALTFNIGQAGAARIRVVPGGNPEQSSTTFKLSPTFSGGEETLLHTGNVKTINGNSLFGSGNIAIGDSGGGDGYWELLRTRGATSNLTDVKSGDSVGSVSLTKGLTTGNILAIEVNTQSSYTFKPKIIIVNLNTSSSSPNSTGEYNLYDFSSFNGTNIRHNSFAISGVGLSLYFGSKKYIQGAFSGSNIAWNTGNYTLYVGRVWRLKE